MFNVICSLNRVQTGGYAIIEVHFCVSKLGLSRFTCPDVKEFCLRDRINSQHLPSHNSAQLCLEPRVSFQPAPHNILSTIAPSSWKHHFCDDGVKSSDGCVTPHAERITMGICVISTWPFHDAYIAGDNWNINQHSVKCFISPACTNVQGRR